MDIAATFDRYYSAWGGTTRNHMVRIDAILLRDETAGFTRMAQDARSAWISLYNALDQAEEADRPGCPPSHRLRLLTSLRRILGRG